MLKKTPIQTNVQFWFGHLLKKPDEICALSTVVRLNKLKL